MPNWQPSIDPMQGPLYRAIAAAIADAVERGELKEGDRLPPQRVLARQLGVDLTTVTRAYAEAQHRGLVDATVGRGTFVRGTRPEAGWAMVDMSMNLPPQPPELRGLLASGLQRVLAEAELASLMAYRTGAGSPADRAAGAAWLAPVMGEVDPAHVLVCAGAQAALTGLLTLLARPGDTILTEELTYPGLRGLARQLGLELVAVAGDAEGPLPDALEHACRQGAPKAFYCIPTLHNPTTVTMPAERRAALAGIAHRHGVSIIEDDAYGMLPSTPLPAMAQLVPGSGWYVATLSKCLSPGLRIAHVVAPDAEAAGRLTAALRATSLMPAPVMMALATQWLGDGTAEKLLRAIASEASARQDMAHRLLSAGQVAGGPDGLHVWLTLPAQWDRLGFVAHVRQLGLALVPSDAFLVGPEAPNAVRLSLGAAASRDALRGALRAVNAALLEPPALYPGDIV